MTLGCAEPPMPQRREKERGCASSAPEQGHPSLGCFWELPALALRSSGVTMTTNRMARSFRNIS